MKRKSDFVAVRFNENKPHTVQEWWIYYLNQYVTSEERENNNLLNFIKDKVRKGLVLDADMSLYESLNKPS
jgi:hypothetical protein